MPEPVQDAAQRLVVAPSELVLGGQRSGKSRRAEMLARAWLKQSSDHGAVLIATAQPWDDEMRGRIQRHRRDRAQRVPAMQTIEEPLALADAIAQHGSADTLVVVDCLTLWLTNLLMPHRSQGAAPVQPAMSADYAWRDALVRAIENSAGPVVLVSNEIGLGVIPLGPQVRQFVDALGHLNQHMAQLCTRVTLMAAGLPLMLKDVA